MLSSDNMTSKFDRRLSHVHFIFVILLVIYTRYIHPLTFQKTGGSSNEQAVLKHKKQTCKYHLRQNISK